MSAHIEIAIAPDGGQSIPLVGQIHYRAIRTSNRNKPAVLALRFQDADGLTVGRAIVTPDILEQLGRDCLSIAHAAAAASENVVPLIPAPHGHTALIPGLIEGGAA